MYRELSELTNKKTNDPIKVGGGSEYTCLQRRHTDGPEAHEKMLIIGHQEMQTNAAGRHCLTLLGGL